MAYLQFFDSQGVVISAGKPTAESDECIPAYPAASIMHISLRLTTSVVSLIGYRSSPG